MSRLPLLAISLSFAACSEDYADTEIAPATIARPFTAHESAIYAEVERECELSAPEPQIRFEPAVNCGDGPRCCVLDGSLLGWYDAENLTLVIPDPTEMECAPYYVFAHEAIHHLLYQVGRSDWNVNAAGEHTAPEFARCEGIGRA